MKKLALIALLSIPCFNSYSSLINSQAFPAMNEAEIRALEEELSRMSPEEQQAFQQISNEIRQIEEAVQKMSPEEQKIFQETMEKLSQLPESELERMISGQMSEEEMDSLFTNLFADQVTDPTPTEEPEQKEELPAEPVVSGKYNEIILLIDTIIAKSESFLLKMSSFPDLSGKVLSWSKKGLLNDWGTSSWNIIRADIELLVQKLKKAKELGSDKKSYLYLQDIMDNEPMVNTLKLIKEALNECESCLEIEPFGLEKISTASKKIVQKILHRFAQAIKKGNLIKDLEILFAKQDSPEKKSKSSDAQPVKQPQPSAPIINDDSFEGLPYYDDAYTLRSDANFPIVAMPATVKSPEVISQEKKAAHATDKDKEKKPSSQIALQSEKKSASLNQESLNKSVTAFDKNLKDAATAIEQSLVLGSFKKHLTSKESVDLATANEYLPTAVNKLNTALDTIKIDMSELSGESKKEYQKRLTDAFAKYEKSFDAITQEWNDIEANWQMLESAISADKLYAYIGKSNQTPSTMVAQKVTNPTTYAELFNGIKDIKERVARI